jgi:hypothetical protein
LRHDPVMAVLAGKLPAKRKGFVALACKSRLSGSRCRQGIVRPVGPAQTIRTFPVK